MSARWWALLALAVSVALAPGAAQARWRGARSQSFLVLSRGPADHLRKSVETLETYDRLLRALTGTAAEASPAPFRIYLVEEQRELRQLRDVGELVQGFYARSPGGAAAFAVRGGRDSRDVWEGDEVLLHEYAHHFMMRYHPAYYPTWFVEGFAEFMMTVQILPNRVELGRPTAGRLYYLRQKPWLPISQVMVGNLQGLNQDQTLQFYSQAWLITHYLFTSDARRTALDRYMADLHRGIAEPIAFKTAFGIDHQAFERDLRGHLQRIAYAVVAKPGGSASPIVVAELSESAEHLLLPHVALTIGGGAEMDQRLLDTVRREAGRHSDDPYAQRVLAVAEVASGDKDVGVSIADGLLKTMPMDAELLFVRGLAEYKAGLAKEGDAKARYAAARSWLDKAVTAGPFAYPARYRLAQSMINETGQVSDEALNEMMMAKKLAPVVPDIALNTAVLLESRGRYEEAEAALLPLATSAHDALPERARELLGRVREAQRKQGAAKVEPRFHRARAPRQVEPLVPVARRLGVVKRWPVGAAAFGGLAGAGRPLFGRGGLGRRRAFGGAALRHAAMAGEVVHQGLADDLVGGIPLGLQAFADVGYTGAAAGPGEFVGAFE